jgi:hypothetical protein
VLLRGGARHPGTLVLGAEDAGTPDRLVAVGSYGTGRAIIEAGTAAGIKVYNAGGVAVRDVRVTGAGRELGNRANGIEVYTDLGGARKLDAIRVERVEVSGFGSAGVTVGAWPADGTKSGFRGVRITDVSAHHNADAGVSTWGRTSSTATGYAHADVVVDRVQAYDNPGIAGKGSNSGSGIVIGDVTGALVQRSVAFRNGARNDFAGGGPVGIWAWDSHAVTIQDNESYANASATIDGGGFDLDGGVTGSVLQRNLSHGNAGAGFLLYQYSGARPWGGNTVRFNVSDGDGRTNLAGIYVGGGAGGAQVHHNTVVTRARPSGAMPHAVGVEGARDVRVRDNALATTGTGTLVSVGAGQAGIRFEGNAYPSGAVIRDGDRTVTGLAAWRSLRGQELLDGRGVGVEGAARLPATGDAASTLTAGTVPRERYRPGTGSVLTGTAIDLRARFALDPGPADLVGTLFGTRVPADVGAVQPRPVATTTTTATSSSPAAEDGGAPRPRPRPRPPPRRRTRTRPTPRRTSPRRTPSPTRRTSSRCRPRPARTPTPTSTPSPRRTSAPSPPRASPPSCRSGPSRPPPPAARTRPPPPRRRPPASRCAR